MHDDEYAEDYQKDYTDECIDAFFELDDDEEEEFDLDDPEDIGIEIDKMWGRR